MSTDITMMRHHYHRHHRHRLDSFTSLCTHMPGHFGLMPGGHFSVAVAPRGGPGTWALKALSAQACFGGWPPIMPDCTMNWLSETGHVRILLVDQTPNLVRTICTVFVWFWVCFDKCWSKVMSSLKTLVHGSHHRVFGDMLVRSGILYVAKVDNRYFFRSSSESGQEYIYIIAGT